MNASSVLEPLLGESWPAVRDQLVQLLFRIDEKPSDSTVLREFDLFLEMLLRSSGAELVQSVLADCQYEDLQVRTRTTHCTFPPAEESGSLVVPVYFATNREWVGTDAPESWYSGEPSSLSFGIVNVSVPVNRRIGEIDTPKWWRLEFRADPTKHVKILTVHPLDEASFVLSLSQAVGQIDERDLLVFVHGFNVSFNDAARRAAQIARDLKFAGPTALYSWPSLGNVSSYVADEDRVIGAIPYFKSFLRLLVTKSGAKKLHLLSHSMGGRILVRTLEHFDFATLPAGSTSLGHVVFAAPDINREEFLQAANTIPERTSSLTLYASSTDLALRASRLLHRAPRAGDAGPSLIVRLGLETVDASTVDSSLFGLGHSYFSNKRQILNDLFNMIVNGMPPSKRFDLERAVSAAGQYWLYRE
jgi:esterase/lipase superfamily enzyme